MAIFEHERKNGIQLGTVGDECMECAKKHRADEVYVPESLDYKPVYKIWIHNRAHCICLDCFKQTLGNYTLLDLTEEKEDKQSKAKTSPKKKEDKKEVVKDGGETA